MKPTKLSLIATAFAAFLLSSCSKPSEQMPIMAWCSIPSSEATPQRYQELAECGFNINFSFFGSLGELKQSLDLADQAGVKVMAGCEGFEYATDSIVSQIKDHPALYGYFLCDEPACPGFPALAAWAERIKAVDDTKPLYLNLLPNFVDTTVLTCNYRQYVRRFIEEVKLPMVSFDYYPVTFTGITSQFWYENMQIIHEESQAAGLPFWAFALATAHDPYPLPTMASLRVELYTALAYGAQGLQYFTYWNPGTEVWNFHEAPINQNRERSEAWYLVQAMNREIQARAHVFLGCNVLSVNHVGEEMYPGCTRLEELPAHVTELEISPSGAVVSVLENGDWNYLVLVSRSLDTKTDLSIAFDTKVCMIDREGKAVKLAKGENNFSIDEGDIAIFRYRK